MAVPPPPPLDGSSSNRWFRWRNFVSHCENFLINTVEWMLVLPTSWTCLYMFSWYRRCFEAAQLQGSLLGTPWALYSVFPAFYLQSFWLYMVTFSEVQMVIWLQLRLLFISSAAFIFLMVSFIALISSHFKCHLVCFCKGKIAVYVMLLLRGSLATILQHLWKSSSCILSINVTELVLVYLKVGVAGKTTGKEQVSQV